MGVKEEIYKLVRTVVSDEYGLEGVEFVVERPKDESFGDWSSNVAMAVFKKLSDRFESPRDLAEAIVKVIEERLEGDGSGLLRFVKVVGVAGGGFINFRVSDEYFVSELKGVIQEGDRYGFGDWGQGKKVFVEYTDPNPFKVFHIGHLMSNTVGESLARLLEVGGWVVRRANYQGDVGMHVAKAIWGMMRMMDEDGIDLGVVEGWSLDERVKWMGKAYALGASEYKNGGDVADEIKLLNKKIYERDESVAELYDKGRKWSLEYFEKIYERLGTKFDEYFFESESGKIGLAVVEDGLSKGVFEESDGAVVYRGDKVGLHTRVFRNSLGLPTYEAKDLGLAKLKWERWRYDRSIIVTANEVDDYFKVVLSAMRELYPDLADRTEHVSHGVMKLPTGKMSSRTGVVVGGEELLDDLKKVVMERMKDGGVDSERVADVVGVGALKYAVLRQDVKQDIVYEREKMLSLSGNSGPYLQYTYARGMSVLKGVGSGVDIDVSVAELDDDERGVVRWLVRYPEVVETASVSLAPSRLSGFLYELASRYNSFYGSCRIVGDEREGVRVLITKAVTQVLKNGLWLLGIGVVEKM